MHPPTSTPPHPLLSPLVTRQIKHPDQVSTTEWEAELRGCANECQNMHDCVTFVATVGTEGEWAECTFYSACESEAVSPTELFTTSRYDVHADCAGSAAAKKSARSMMNLGSIKAKVAWKPAVVGSDHQHALREMQVEMQMPVRRELANEMYGMSSMGSMGSMGSTH